MKSRWFAPHALLLHVALIVWVGGCSVAGGWQIARAAQGNALSYAYAVEWPVFAVAGFFGWWALLHTEQPNPEEQVARAHLEEELRDEAQRQRHDSAEQEDPTLAAYNDHLATLAGQPKKKLWGH